MLQAKKRAPPSFLSNWEEKGFYRKTRRGNRSTVLCRSAVALREAYPKYKMQDLAKSGHRAGEGHALHAS